MPDNFAKVPFEDLRRAAGLRFASDSLMRVAVMEAVERSHEAVALRSVTDNLRHQNSEQGAALRLCQEQEGKLNTRANQWARKAKRRSALLPIGIGIGFGVAVAVFR